MAAKPRLHIFISNIPIHREYKLKKTKNKLLKQAVDAVKYAIESFSSRQWSAEDAFSSEPDFLARNC